MAPSSLPAIWTVREKYSDPISFFIFDRWNCQATVEEPRLVVEYSNLYLRVVCDVVRRLGTWERWENSTHHIVQI